MKIAKAKVQDIPSIMNMFMKCISTMESQEIYQWNEHYPTTLIIKDDIANGYGYSIVVDNTCVAYFVINDDQPLEYSKITWTGFEGKNLIIHRLAVHPDFQGRGIASMLMRFIEDYAIRNSYKSIRLDVFSVNKVAQRLYYNKGFQYFGEVNFPYRDQPFYCMEKYLE